MSFSADAKMELCRCAVQKQCCAQAEAYGVLLYANTFSSREIRIITESAEFAARLHNLFQKAFHITFDRSPEGLQSKGKHIFQITDSDKLAAIIEAFGYDPQQNIQRATAQNKTDRQGHGVLCCRSRDLSHDHGEHDLAQGGQRCAEQIQQQDPLVFFIIWQKASQ